MMGLGLIVPLLLVGVFVYMLGWRPQDGGQFNARPSGKTPLEILKERYARGEISRAEYEDMRRDLEY
jgi:putative membrane protein